MIAKHVGTRDMSSVRSHKRAHELKAMENPTPKDQEFLELIQIHRKNHYWSKEEHDKFMYAIRFYGKDWDKIQAYVGTKNLAQCMGHPTHLVRDREDKEMEMILKKAVHPAMW